MRLPSTYYSYLRGESYSSGLRVMLSSQQHDQRQESRADILVRICTGKDVIHVGFADHNTETIDSKLASGAWLHALLCDSANRCFGVDIVESAVTHARENLGYADVAVLNLLSEPHEMLDGQNWDYLLLPEILEHVDDPFGFLSGLHTRFVGQVEKLVVTVPNAFSLVNYKWARRNVECINSDHRFWFTPYTLAKLAVMAGYIVEDIQMCQTSRSVGGIRAYASEIRHPELRQARRYPLLRQNMIMTLTFSGGSSVDTNLSPS